jgi:predicted GNAT family acetyltransferase
MTDPIDVKVVHNPAEKRFEVSLNGETALMEYMLAGTNMIFTHTEVPPAFEGRGIGNQMAHYGLTYAREHGYRVQALCPFVAAFVKRHKEYQDITWGY